MTVLHVCWTFLFSVEANSLKLHALQKGNMESWVQFSRQTDDDRLSSIYLESKCESSYRRRCTTGSLKRAENYLISGGIIFLHGITIGFDVFKWRALLIRTLYVSGSVLNKETGCLEDLHDFTLYIRRKFGIITHRFSNIWMEIHKRLLWMRLCNVKWLNIIIYLESLIY
jgi:hypothetical protein